VSSSGSWWNRTLVYLGLKEEPEDAYDEAFEHARHAPDNGVAVAPDDGGRGDVTVRPLRPAPAAEEGAGGAVGTAARAAVVEIADFEDVE
jgi:hypothetical protein